MMHRAVHAEFLKVKRSLVPWILILAPLAINGLMLLVLLRRKNQYESPVAPWDVIANSANGIWALLMFPLVIALLVALTGHLEYAGRQWKHLLALPNARWHHFAGKLIANLTFLFFASVAMSLSSIATGFVAYLLRPDLDFVLEFDPVLTFLPPLVTLVAFLPVIVLQTWTSVRFSGMVPGLSLGIFGVVVTLVIIGSRYSPWFPWSFPGLANISLQSLLKGSGTPAPLDDLWLRLSGFATLGLFLMPICSLELLNRDRD